MRRPRTSTRSRRHSSDGRRSTDAALADRHAQPHRLPVADAHRRPRRPRPGLQRRGHRRATKAVMGLPDEPFWVPDDVLAAYRESGARGRAHREDWEQRAAERAGRPARPNGRPRWRARRLPGWADALPTFATERHARHPCGVPGLLTALAGNVPGLMAGAADLTGNTGTKLTGPTGAGAGHAGRRQIHFGIREHAMGVDPGRRRATRRRAARRRHVPGVQRLHAAGGAAGRAEPGQVRVRVEPRLGRRGRGRPHPPARSST